MKCCSFYHIKKVCIYIFQVQEVGWKMPKWQTHWQITWAVVQILQDLQKTFWDLCVWWCKSSSELVTVLENECYRLFLGGSFKHILFCCIDLGTGYDQPWHFCCMSSLVLTSRLACLLDCSCFGYRMPMMRSWSQTLYRLFLIHQLHLKAASWSAAKTRWVNEIRMRWLFSFWPDGFKEEKNWLS